jgi:hypothetical protein
MSFPIPKQGTYQAPNSSDYQFHISHANPQPGDIRGTYTTNNSLAGEPWTSDLGDYSGDFVQPERSSSYSWVARTEGGVRVAEPPFLIRIIGTKSQKNKDDQKFWHCQQSWTGTYLQGDVIEMGGTETYLESNDGGATWTTTVRFMGPLQFKCQS